MSPLEHLFENALVSLEEGNTLTVDDVKKDSNILHCMPHCLNEDFIDSLAETIVTLAIYTHYTYCGCCEKKDRPTARWNSVSEISGRFECGNCKTRIIVPELLTPFCPDCGYEMLNYKEIMEDIYNGSL